MIIYERPLVRCLQIWIFFWLLLQGESFIRRTAKNALGPIDVNPWMSNSFLLQRSCAHKVDSPFYIDAAYFPVNLEELAEDACFSMEYGYVKNLSRMAIFADSPALYNSNDSLRWLFIIARRFELNHRAKVRIVLSSYIDLIEARQLYQEVIANYHPVNTIGERRRPLPSNRRTRKNSTETPSRVLISPISSYSIPRSDDDIVIVFGATSRSSANDYNLPTRSEGEIIIPEVFWRFRDLNVLETIERLHKQATGVGGVPVIWVNPELYSQYGRQTFVQNVNTVYSLHDNISMPDSNTSRNINQDPCSIRQWLGGVQRLDCTLDVYFCEKNSSVPNQSEVSKFRIETAFESDMLSPIEDQIKNIGEKKKEFVTYLSRTRRN